MKPEEMLFCNLMQISLHPDRQNTILQESPEQITKALPQLVELARLHNMLPALCDVLYRLDVPLTADAAECFSHKIPAICYQCYDMLAFSKKVIAFLDGLSITFFVLKGVTLLPAYPKLEYRQYGDVDIFIPDAKEYELAMQSLLAAGFVPRKDYVDHHIELTYTIENTTYLLELHNKIIATQSDRNFQKQLECIFQNVTPAYDTFSEAGIRYPMLSPTTNALYLLLHMLQHFLSAGFGIKLLYDWVAYLERYASDISFEELQNNVNLLGISGFCNAITRLCLKHLGLSLAKSDLLLTKPLDDTFLSSFMDDILSAGEFGKTDTARLLIMQKGGRFSQYFHEFHRQMKNRFPKAHKIIPLWPFLWLITGFCFVWNNHFLRKTKTSTLLATTKKRQKLLQHLHLFQTRDN